MILKQIAATTSKIGKPKLKSDFSKVERKIATEITNINDITREIERIEEIMILLEKNIEENEVKKSEVIT